jgi:hypothetical protein
MKSLSKQPLEILFASTERRAEGHKWYALVRIGNDPLSTEPARMIWPPPAPSTPRQCARAPFTWANTCMHPSQQCVGWRRLIAAQWTKVSRSGD